MSLSCIQFLGIASMEHKLYVNWQLWCQHYQVAMVTDEWNVYQAGQVDEKSATRRVDNYWADVFQEMGVNASISFFRSLWKAFSV